MAEFRLVGEIMIYEELDNKRGWSLLLFRTGVFSNR
jgi:hypothetical protein